MAREKGTFNFSANLEVKKQGPLDARQTMITYAELTQAATWQDESGKMYLFNGLIVPVTNGSEKQVYMLIDAAKYNQAASWKRIDAGAAVPKEEVFKLPGDALSLNSESDPANIKGVYGTLSIFKAAVLAKKVIIGSSDATTYYVGANLIADSQIAVVIYAGSSVVIHNITISDSDYVSIDVEKKVFASLDEIVQSVTATANKGIEIGGTANKPTVGLKIDTVTPGNVDLAVGANGLKATLSSKAVKSGDKVLKVETDKSLSVTISLGYNSETKKLQLKGINDEVFAELDASAFIKDGMLNTVELVVNPEGQSAGTYIKMTFNTDAGKEPIFLNVTGLIDVYVAGNGISISGKTIAVKLDTAGNTEGYLKLTAAGLKVEGVNAAVAAAIAEAFSWHDA